MKSQKNNYEGLPASRRKPLLFTPLYFVMLTIALMAFGCQKTDFTDMGTADDSMEMKRLRNSDCEQINLVGNNDEYTPVFIETDLINAWGLAFDDGEAWVAAAETGKTFVFGADGETLMPAISIPGAAGGGALSEGNPTGVVYNESEVFDIPLIGAHSEFIFATENGTIAAWASGGAATTVVDRSAEGAVYKGITIGRSMTGQWFLYATDFHNGRVDVFDANFNYMAAVQFVDSDMPAGFAPFNIKFIDNVLYVTYAKQLAPDNVDDERGPGNGYVDVYNIDGTFIKRFASGGSLNSPWGIAQKPGFQGAILIGNFGSGRISVFTAEGVGKSYLQSGGVPVDIQGLWAIEFPRGTFETEAENERLYFTAGPDDEEEGLFGYLDPVL